MASHTCHIGPSNTPFLISGSIYAMPRYLYNKLTLIRLLDCIKICHEMKFLGTLIVNEFY